MKLRKIRVPEFINLDGFGSFKARNVEILFDPSENEITPDNFDQENHVYFLSDREIERLAREAAQRFYDANAAAILRGTRKFKRKEVNAIKDVLKISGAELGDLIGLDKSSISRILSSKAKQELQKDKAMLLLERLRDELEHPGKNKILLSHLRDETSPNSRYVQVCLPAAQVAEFFIRRFRKTEGPITHLKLQKLLYYTQGVGFGRSNMKLIKEPFYAWEHGPVIREIYHHYKGFGDSPLEVDDKIDLTELQSNETILSLLEETISLYGVYDAWFLREKTHTETPWLETPQNDMITDEKMIQFFKQALV